MRVLRLFHFFRDLRLMVSSLFLSFRSLSWALFLMLLLIFCVSVMLCQGVSEYITNEKADHTWLTDTLNQYYGSMLRTMFTLILAITGGRDWYELIIPLYFVSPFYSTMFVFYELFVLFGMLNVLTAVFCDRASELSHLDRDLIVESEKFKLEHTKESLKTLFREADADNSGYISVTEFQLYCEREDVQEFFATMDMPMEETKDIFHVFDVNRSGRVNIDAFVNGCLRVKGHAKNLDILHILDAVQKVAKNLSHVDKSLTGFIAYYEAKHRSSI